MGLLKHFRSRNRLKESKSPQPQAQVYKSSPRSGPDLTQQFSNAVLANIFIYVCPHTQDLSYEPCEQSQIGDGCMLCDLRDLAECAKVCRKWAVVAQKLLYTSVRIDAVHYCALEEELAERRKKAAKHFRGKSIPPVEIPNIRLSLFCRTVREQPVLAAFTLALKIPYMTRETAKGDLARTVSALPNLRYVDLPEGFFSGDSSCLALRQELQARCPDIRQMLYQSGAEEAFQLLARRHWQALEILHLSSLAIEPATMRMVLASLPTLHELTLSDMTCIDDSIFQPSLGTLPDFPALQSLKLINIPNVTAQGFQSWLSAAHVREILASLLLESTGVTVQDLHTVLAATRSLRNLAILETVSKSLSLAAQQMPPLASPSLKSLNFEISCSDDVHGLQKPTESYYAYLASSLHQNTLPALETLYVRDQTFPELLVLPPVVAPFAGASGPRSRVPPTGFNQQLEIFSKGLDESEWVFTSILPPPDLAGSSSNGSRVGGGHTRNSSSVSISGGRPLSAYSASRGLGPQWAQGGFGGEARKSVIVGNGFGGFLAVPQEEAPRPLTADGTGGTQWSGLSPPSPLRNGDGGSTVDNGQSPSKSDRFSFFKPPPSMAALAGHERRGSKQDLWR